MIKRLKHKLINHLVRKLLKTFTDEDIEIISKKEVLVGDLKLTQEEIQSLKEDAKLFYKSNLWYVLRKHLGYRASRQMIEEATKPDDIVFGKAMTWNLHLIDQFIKNLTTKL